MARARRRGVHVVAATTSDAPRDPRRSAPDASPSPNPGGRPRRRRRADATARRRLRRDGGARDRPPRHRLLLHPVRAAAPSERRPGTSRSGDAEIPRRRHLQLSCARRWRDKIDANRRGEAALRELLLLPAEDLTPYREASESVFAVLCAFGPTQKLGLDEFFVDLTNAARESGESGWESATHVHRAAHGTTTAEKLSKSGTNMRPMDLRAARRTHLSALGGRRGCAGAAARGGHARCAPRQGGGARRDGLRTSVGVASNRCSPSSRRPPQARWRDVSSPTPRPKPRWRRCRCARCRASAPKWRRARALDVATVADVRRVAAHRLASAVGGAAATRLAALARGLDSDPLVPSGAPKSLSVMDSFKHADSHEQLRRCLAVLAPDLRRRLAADRRDHRRRATSMVVRWRHSTARTMNHPGGVATGAAVAANAADAGAAAGRGGAARLRPRGGGGRAAAARAARQTAASASRSSVWARRNSLARRTRRAGERRCRLRRRRRPARRRWPAGSLGGRRRQPRAPRRLPRPVGGAAQQGRGADATRGRHLRRRGRRPGRRRRRPA